jgi:hypothetical protein
VSEERKSRKQRIVAVAVAVGSKQKAEGKNSWEI